MNKITASRTKQIVFVLFALAWTFCIWKHSMCTANISSAQSGRVEQLLTPILDFFCVSESIRQFVIRKAAHFTEFAVLGLLWAGAFQKRVFLYPFSISVLTAVVDEGIQLFVPGRSGQLKDVLLDSSGAAAALVFLWVIRFFLERKVRKKNA